MGGERSRGLAADQGASEMRISTFKPAAPIISTKVSRPNSSLLPRMRSEIRGLRNAKQFGGLRLAESRSGDMILQSHH